MSTRIQIHDFSGHPFQADLSRQLARSGFEVEHIYSAQYASGKGRLEREPGDPATLTFTPLEVNTSFNKYSPAARMRFELAYAKAWKRQLAVSQPDLVIACNVPLFALATFRRWAKRIEHPWIFWHQDVYSLGMADELDRRFPRLVAAWGRRVFGSMERRITADASHVIAIGDEFAQQYSSWNIPRSQFTIIPNWAPVADILPSPRDNRWAREHLTDREGIRLLYAGMLGRKHNPQLLIDLVDGLQAEGQACELVVVSEGDGIEELRETMAERPELPVTILPFQSAHDLPLVLGSGDFLVALLEPEASKFSIPSKVLSYLSAGRPIIGLMPSQNPAAEDIRATGGFVGQPSSNGVKQACAWANEVYMDSDRAESIGRRARERAEEKFGIGPITDSFVAVIESVSPTTTTV